MLIAKIMTISDYIFYVKIVILFKISKVIF
jgi:hypothetical protein